MDVYSLPVHLQGKRISEQFGMKSPQSMEQLFYN